MRDVLLAVSLTRDVIPQADGGERYEAEIQRLQEVPVPLQGHEDPRRDENQNHGHEDGQTGGVYGRQLGHRHGPAAVEVGHGTAGHHNHDLPHDQGEEEEGDGDAEEGVEDAESLPFIREWDSVAVAWERKHTDRTVWFGGV